MSNSVKNSSVLIVDDHGINRLMLKMPLKKAGFEVTLAPGGQEALDLLNLGNEDNGQPQFDIVILDIMMPEVDGIEVLKKIREYHPPEVLPVIMATAIKYSKNIVELLKMGANDYVTKPIDIPVLTARVEVHDKLRKTHLMLLQAKASLAENQQRLQD